MTRLFAPQPTGLPALAAFAVGALAFVLAVLIARTSRSPAGEAGGTRLNRSLGGVMLQGLGIAIAGFGPQRVTLDPLAAPALIEAAVVAVLMAGAVALFATAAAAMGRNWSIVARTRGDHALVQSGPFAYVRHPIYTGMALFMAALALAFGHPAQLLPAVPVFALGTWRRVSVEEGLLRERFGRAYDAYAARVRRFVPGLF